jgi:predicted dehydrogenase
MIRVGIVGYGYWGPNVARNFAASSEAKLIKIVDLRPERRALAEKNHPGIATTSDFNELLVGDEVDVIVVATPLSTHYELAKAALISGRHVLVEKPLTATSEEAADLIETAERRNLVLMVDHTFIYSEAIRKVSSLVASGEIGDIYYFDSVRVNLGLFQHDTNVLYDLAVHDLSIMDHILPEQPVAVSATGSRHFQDQSENIAFLTFFFQSSSLISHIHVNWLAPLKLRRTMFGGSRKMIVYDDLEPTEKIRIYDKGVEFTNDPDGVKKRMVSYRSGDLWVPNLELREPLANMTKHFLDCVNSNSHPLTDGHVGLRIVRYLEAADASMMQRGTPVDILRD